MGALLTGYISQAAKAHRPALRMGQRRLLPGFGLSLGYTVFYLSLIVLIPVSALLFKASVLGRADWAALLRDPRVQAALWLTFGASGLAALLNVFFGFIVAWVLVRYEFPGKGLVDSLVDMPFALPTAVAGIALTAVYAPQGWLGKILLAHGVQAAFSRLGVLIALTFIGLPFVVRTLQPVMEDMDRDAEEAALTLGAGRGQTFWRILLPPLVPALLTGFTLAFARALGEYGSVVFISGNMPFKTEVVSLLIMTKLEQYDYAGAMALGLLMLGTSFLLLLILNQLQNLSRRRKESRA